VANLRKLLASLLAGIGSAAAGFFTTFLPYGALLVLAAAIAAYKLKQYRSAIIIPYALALSVAVALYIFAYIIAIMAIEPGL